ncbi:MAG: hypothetical protein WA949_19325 [Phormidesmis sp.]
MRQGMEACGHPYVDFMVPDFSQLRKQPRDHTSERSTNVSDRKGFNKLKRSQQFNKQSDSTTARETDHNNSSASKPNRRKKKRSKPVSQYVIEYDDNFLALWPHRFDYLYAPHPDPGTKPDWQTESRYPLSDRTINQGTYLYGVRPSAQTNYVLLDLDKDGPYHPSRDPLVLSRINEALEPLGLVADLKLTSSDSQGLHIYSPVQTEVPSWQLGLAVTTLLENKGFKVRSGWLEVFPNRKAFSVDGSYSLFNGHRLPLQQGSYLLNDDLQPIASSQQAFVRQWHAAAAQNDISASVLKQTIRQALRKTYRVTGKAQKFLNDLNAEVETGWTGRGQTNYLLGRITMRSYIFGHILGAEAPLTGQALVDDIVRIARSLPGFKDYCGHQHDLEKRVKEWVRSIEGDPTYYAYGSGKAVKQQTGPTWNQQQQAEAREHIRQVTVELFRQDAFPEDITPRFLLLCSYSISGSTLYKNRDLWHPVYISEQQKQLIANLPRTPDLQLREGAASAVGASAPSNAPSLLGPIGCKTPDDAALSGSTGVESGLNQAAGCKTPDDKALSPVEVASSSQEIERTPPPEQLVLNIQGALQLLREKQQAQAEMNQQQYREQKRQRARAERIARLQAWLDSGDPILVAEARHQLQRIEPLAAGTA